MAARLELGASLGRTRVNSSTTYTDIDGGSVARLRQAASNRILAEMIAAKRISIRCLLSTDDGKLFRKIRKPTPFGVRVVDTKKSIRSSGTSNRVRCERTAI
jgi:hypothetical protein